MNIKPIRNEKDYESTLQRVESLMDAAPGSEAFDELEILTTLIENYEAKYYTIDTPDPIEAIKFRMEQEGLKQKDLVSIFGNKVRVSEILNKKRKLTLDMIRNIHESLNIPFESLLNKYDLPNA
ncbi:helix-turn-helix domain-containing protein [Sulfurovum riftiae]|uniref:DNA-binding protein n=1 Tax=Sulfurovum riftiae TaxID=1630136 RepID=A0A151CDH4_9BACT|nr:DNA-binding protein [Sulfurovum riftiae]KYJ85576.1 DNA-binding protein [Sulfurovum riftiae]